MMHDAETVMCPSCGTTYSATAPGCPGCRKREIDELVRIYKRISKRKRSLKPRRKPIPPCPFCGAPSTYPGCYDCGTEIVTYRRREYTLPKLRSVECRMATDEYVPGEYDDEISQMPNVRQLSVGLLECNEREYVTVREAAEMLGVSISTIYKHIERGQLRRIQTNPWHITLPVADIRAMLAKMESGRKRDDVQHTASSEA